MFVSNRPRHAAELERRQSTGARAAARRRREPRQHLHRRRRGRRPDDGQRRPQAWPDRRRATTPTSPSRTPRCAPCSASWPRWSARCSRPRRSAAATCGHGCTAAGVYPLAPGLHDGAHPRRDRRDADRRHARRAAPSSTPTSSATTRSRTTPASSATTRWTRCAGWTTSWPGWRAPPSRWRGPTGSSSCPTTARARARPSAPATAAPWPSWSATRAAGRPPTPASRTRRAAGEESWGYAGGALTEIAAGPGLGGRAAGRATRDRRQGRGRRRRHRTGGGRAGRRGTDGGGHGPGVRQPRPGLPHARPAPADPRADRRALPGPDPDAAGASRRRLPARRDRARAGPVVLGAERRARADAPGWCAAWTRWRRSASTRARRSRGPTPTRTAPT